MNGNDVAQVYIYRLDKILNTPRIRSTGIHTIYDVVEFNEELNEMSSTLEYSQSGGRFHTIEKSQETTNSRALYRQKYRILGFTQPSEA